MRILDTIRDEKLSMSFEVFPPKTDAAFEEVLQATEAIAGLSADGTRGARDIRSCIRKNVEDIITAEMVSRIDNPLKSVSVTGADGKVVCKFK